MTRPAQPFRHTDGSIDREAAITAGRRERALAARAGFATIWRFLQRALSTTGALQANVYASPRQRR